MGNKKFPLKEKKFEPGEYIYLLYLYDWRAFAGRQPIAAFPFSIGIREKLDFEEYLDFLVKLEEAINKVAEEYRPRSEKDE